MKFNQLIKVLSSIIFLIFGLQSWTKAEDIKDFEIAGLSVGDSLLDLASASKINSLKSPSQYPNDKFIIYILDDLVSLENYDFVSATTRKNDQKFIITSVNGGIDYKDLEVCLDLKKKIQIDLENIFTDFEKDETEYKTKADKTGKSKIYGVQYYFKPYPSVEGVSVNCYHMSKESGVDRTLKVLAASEDYARFLIDDAYN